jgi:hypothetical protein
VTIERVLAIIIIGQRVAFGNTLARNVQRQWRMGAGGASEHRQQASASGVTGFQDAVLTPEGERRLIVR